jgi:membrane associated rhomboid family serine protease
MPRAMLSSRRLFVVCCWGAVIVAYVAAILPQQDAPHLGGSDKMDHMAAFFSISVLARLAYPDVGFLRLFVPIALFGGFIEISQMVPFLHRDAEWADWFADVAASLTGLLLAWPLARYLRRRRGLSNDRGQ